MFLGVSRILRLCLNEWISLFWLVFIQHGSILRDRVTDPTLNSPHLSRIGTESESLVREFNVQLLNLRFKAWTVYPSIKHLSSMYLYLIKDRTQHLQSLQLALYSLITNVLESNGSHLQLSLIHDVLLSTYEWIYTKKDLSFLFREQYDNGLLVDQITMITNDFFRIFDT